jgi:hypothetical protein
MSPSAFGEGGCPNRFRGRADVPIRFQGRADVPIRFRGGRDVPIRFRGGRDVPSAFEGRVRQKSQSTHSNIFNVCIGFNPEEHAYKQLFIEDGLCLVLLECVF